MSYIPTTKPSAPPGGGFRRIPCPNRGACACNGACYVSEQDYQQFYRPLKEVFVERDGRFVIPRRVERPEDV